MTRVTPTTEKALLAARSLFPVFRSRAYLYWGGLAPAAEPVAEAMEGWIDRWREDPIFHRSRYSYDLEGCRELLGLLLDVESSSIALVDNTSRAANLAVAVIAAQPGQNVVVDQTTYDSSVFPWLLKSRDGIELRTAPGSADPADAIASVVDDGTAAVSVSHVSHKTGFRHDLAALSHVAHGKGAFLLVDVAQSAGVTPIALADSGVDVAYGLSMKWLCGPPNLGYLYLSPELMAGREPPHVGHFAASRGSDGGLIFKPGGQRYDIGVANLPGLAGFRAALQLVLATGVKALALQAERLTDAVMDGLRSRGISTLTPASAVRRAGIVAAIVQRPADLRAFLRDRAVDVWTWEHDGRLRVDCHGFNSDDDVAQFFDGLDAFEAARGRLGDLV